jgi:hypothetical protein
MTIQDILDEAYSVSISGKWPDRGQGNGVVVVTMGLGGK